MAGSRLEKFGSIFSRVTGLLRSGALKEEDRPLWYDVYKAFPPKYEPTFKRPFEMKEIRPIIYAEDVVRAKFYKKYNIGTIDIMDQKSKIISETFLEKYQELEKTGQYASESELFKATEDVLKMQGILQQQQQTSSLPQARLPETKRLAAYFLEATEKDEESKK